MIPPELHQTPPSPAAGHIWTEPLRPLRGSPPPVSRSGWYAPLLCLSPPLSVPPLLRSSLPLSSPEPVPHIPGVCTLSPTRSPLLSTRPRTLHTAGLSNMKQPLADLMRMNRICRMVLATCLGSFILVIFYFQSMFQPGRSSFFHLSSAHGTARFASAPLGSCTVAVLI
ncbi:hypothetical protein NL108_018020 [Boleophthalmus pectinirostris]|nr:hypothetical protein NL108_018020 [Boleophthalmus pectinirostris]